MLAVFLNVPFVSFSDQLSFVSDVFIYSECDHPTSPSEFFTLYHPSDSDNISIFDPLSWTLIISSSLDGPFLKFKFSVTVPLTALAF